MRQALPHEPLPRQLQGTQYACECLTSNGSKHLVLGMRRLTLALSEGARQLLDPLSVHTQELLSLYIEYITVTHFELARRIKGG